MIINSHVRCRYAFIYKIISIAIAAIAASSLSLSCCCFIPTSAFATPLEEANAILDSANAARDEAQLEYDESCRKIDEMQAELEQAEKELGEKQVNAACAANNIYKSDSDFMIVMTALFSCKTLNEFFTAIDNMHLIYEKSVRAVEESSEQKDALEQKRAAMEIEKEDNAIKLAAAQSAIEDAEQAQAEARKALLSSDAGIAMAQLASAVACTWYPTDRILDSDGNPWTWDDREDIAKYRRLGEAVMANTPEHRKKEGYHSGYNNWAWSSCHQAACVIIKAVADPDVDMGCPELGEEYFQNTPDRWLYVGSTSRTDDPMLKAGDILNITSPFTHTSIFLGHEAVEMFHPGCDGVIFEASYSNGQCKYPGITSTGVGGNLGVSYNVYRFIGTPVDSIGIENYL